MKRILKIIEGVEFDENSKTVSFSKYEDIVDTSLFNNPSKNVRVFPTSKIEKFCNGVDVWSIFRRKRFKTLDGNPLIYALKHENGWKFKSEKDYHQILEQIHLIVEKFAKTHSYDALLIVPSSNPLNDFLAEIVEEHLHCKYLKGVLRKLYIGEVLEHVLEDNSTFRKIYKNDFDNALKELETYFAKMSPNTHYPMDAVFKRHKIANAEMRNAIDKTLAVADPNSYHTELNNKNILIIDDIISRGASIRESIKIIKQTYTPKSITILTLLSKL